jgi:hypothetical protein
LTQAARPGQKLTDRETGWLKLDFKRLEEGKETGKENVVEQK